MIEIRQSVKKRGPAMVIVPPLTPRYDKNSVYERLHVEPGSAAWEYNEEIFPDVMTEIMDRLRIHDCVLIPDRRLVTGVEEIDRAEKQVICMIAIEQNVMDKMDEYLADYDFPEAYLLDQMVNEILFNAGDDLSLAAAEAMKAEGLGVTRRYIPGDEPLPMTAQGQMLDCLKEVEEASVLSVSERGALRPEKAALYLFGADPAYL